MLAQAMLAMLGGGGSEAATQHLQNLIAPGLR